MSKDDKCYLCGFDRENVLEQHHLIPRRYDGTDREENLVTLCPNCHSGIESIYDDDFFDRLLENRLTTVRNEFAEKIQEIEQQMESFDGVDMDLVDLRHKVFKAIEIVNEQCEGDGANEWRVVDKCVFEGITPQQTRAVIQTAEVKGDIYCSDENSMYKFYKLSDSPSALTYGEVDWNPLKQ